MRRICLIALVGAVCTVNAYAFDLASDSFRDGEEMPPHSLYDVLNESPDLSWREAPERTASFALTCVDPDAPGRVSWTHWIIYNIPVSWTSLPRNLPKKVLLSDGIRQGRNDFKETGYGGPIPPPGATHRYVFTLYALDTAVSLGSEATRLDFEKAIAGHVLGKAVLTGTNTREIVSR